MIAERCVYQMEAKLKRPQSCDKDQVDQVRSHVGPARSRLRHVGCILDWEAIFFLVLSLKRQQFSQCASLALVVWNRAADVEEKEG